MFFFSFLKKKEKEIVPYSFRRDKKNILLQKKVKSQTNKWFIGTLKKILVQKYN